MPSGWPHTRSACLFLAWSSLYLLITECTSDGPYEFPHPAFVASDLEEPPGLPTKNDYGSMVPYPVRDVEDATLEKRKAKERVDLEGPEVKLHTANSGSRSDKLELSHGWNARFPFSLLGLDLGSELDADPGPAAALPNLRDGKQEKAAASKSSLRVRKRALVGDGKGTHETEVERVSHPANWTVQDVGMFVHLHDTVGVQGSRGRAQQPVRFEQLVSTIDTQRFPVIDLDACKDAIKPRQGSPSKGLPPCPEFQSCRISSISEATEGCQVDAMSDPSPFDFSAPVNCPFIKPNKASNWVVFNSSCSHPLDLNRAYPRTAKMVALQNVYVNDAGSVFSATHKFIRGGCLPLANSVYWNGTRVKAFKELLNAAHPYANFYHNAIEVSSILAVASGLLESHPTIPVVAKLGHVFSPNTLAYLRTKYFLPQEDPRFRQDWKPGVSGSENCTQRSGEQDWLVMLVNRRGVKRHLKQHKDVEKLLVDLFGPKRVVVFEGGLDILQAQALFNRVRLLVGPHGAAFTNTIFMPRNSYILELRPIPVNRFFFHALSDLCHLHYFLLLGKGDLDRVLDVDMNEVSPVLKRIAAMIAKEGEPCK